MIEMNHADLNFEQWQLPTAPLLRILLAFTIASEKPELYQFALFRQHQQISDLLT